MYFEFIVFVILVNGVNYGLEIVDLVCLVLVFDSFLEYIVNIIMFVFGVFVFLLSGKLFLL